MSVNCFKPVKPALGHFFLFNEVTILHNSERNARSDHTNVGSSVNLKVTIGVTVVTPV